MGVRHRNMLQKLTISAVLLLASSLHSADAVACQLPSFYATNGVTASGQYTTMADSNTQACTTVCQQCGQTVGAATATTFTNGLDTVAEMNVLANSICPTITYVFTVSTTSAPPFLGGGVGGAGSGIISSASTTLGAITSTGQTSDPLQASNPAALGTANTHLICPCLVATANVCAICGCTDLGVPSAAPTSAPTTAPTIATNSPTDSWSIDLTDDALSAGDIAGIVIGAVGGSFLFLLIGVLVGGMVGGKSTTAAAPAGQL